MNWCLYDKDLRQGRVKVLPIRYHIKYLLTSDDVLLVKGSAVLYTLRNGIGCIVRYWLYALINGTFQHIHTFFTLASPYLHTLFTIENQHKSFIAAFTEPATGSVL